MRRQFAGEAFPVTSTMRAPEGRTFDTAAEALDFYNMNWIAEEHPLMTGSGLEVTSHKALVRNDTGKVISVVGKDYTPIQNNDSFAAFDILCKKYGAKWTRGVTMYGGRKTMLQAVIGHGEVRKGDIIENRITGFNAFDGSSSWKLFDTPMRLVCLNGMRAADNASAIKVAIRHTKNAMYKYEEALRVFNVAQKQFMEFIETSRALAQKMIDRDKAIKLIREVFEIPAEQTTEEIPAGKRVKMNTVYSLFREGKGNQGDSAYDFMNGVTEFVDHHSGKTGEDHEVYAMIGAGARMKQRAMNLAVGELK